MRHNKENNLSGSCYSILSSMCLSSNGNMSANDKSAIDELSQICEKKPEVIKRKRKPRVEKKNKLSQDQVRKNHVVSEQRRRELVRAIYDNLVNIVPDLQPSERRSEILIYLKTMNHLQWLYKRNSYLRKQLAERREAQGNHNFVIPSRLIWELGSDQNPPGGNDSEKDLRNNLPE